MERNNIRDRREFQAASELEEMSKRIIQVSNIPSKVNGIKVLKEHLNMIFTEGFGSGHG